MQVRRRHQAKAAGKNLVFALHLGILSPLPELFNHPDVYIWSNGSTHNTLKYSQVSFSCDTTVAGHTRKHTQMLGLGFLFGCSRRRLMGAAAAAVLWPGQGLIHFQVWSLTLLIHQVFGEYSSHLA